MTDKNPPEIPSKKDSKPENSRKGEITGKLLTTELKRLAQLIHTMDDEGNPLTKLQALSKMVWDKALGYTIEDPQKDTKTEYKPERWAICLLFERLEGKVALADKDSKERPLADRISEAGKSKINKLTSDSK